MATNTDLVTTGGAFALRAANGQYACIDGISSQLLANKSFLSDSTSFTIKDFGNGKITLKGFGGKYVCAEGGGASPLIANRSAAGAWETFDIVYISNDKLALKACNGLYVGAQGGGGQALVANGSAVGAWETFTMVKVETIALQAANGQYVCIDGPGSQLIANKPSIGSSAGLKMNDLGNGKITLKAVNGKYVCAENGGALPLIANRDAAGEWETFEIIHIGNDKMALKACNGLYVFAQGGGGQTLVAGHPAVGEWTTFTIFKKEVPIQPEVTLTTNILSFDGATLCTAQLKTQKTKYTVSLWFKTSNNNCGLFSVVAGDNGTSSSDRHLYFKDGNICARLWSNETITTAGTNFADGKWHKLTYVFGGAIGGQRIYIDGYLEAKGNKAVSDYGSQDGINVGYSNDAANPYFTGDMSEITVWSIARGESEIISLSQTVAGNETGLLAYWNLMDGNNNQVVSRTADKLVLTVNGNAKWQRAEDFSGVFVPVVHQGEVAAIRSQGQQLFEAVTPLGNGYKNIHPGIEVATPLSQLITNGLPQYDLGIRLRNAVENGQLTFTKDLLGDFAKVAQVAGDILNGFITIHDVSGGLVTITPGVSGEPGTPFGSNPATDMTLATAQTTAVKVKGSATIFSNLNVELNYAEFSQLRGQPYGVFKFTSSADLGISMFLPNVPLFRSMTISSPTFILSSSSEIKDGPLDTGLVKGFNFFGSFKLAEAADERFRMIGEWLSISQLNLHGAADFQTATPSYLVEAVIPIDNYIINGSNFKVRLSKAKLGITVKGTPLEPAMNVSCELIVTLHGTNETNLVFTGGLKLEAESVTGMFTMQAENNEPYTSLGGNVVAKGEWKEPFGIPGITIRELAMQIGATYLAPWIDNVGVHGNMKIGDVDGSMSVLVDANDTDQFVLAGATDHITMLQIMTSMCVPTYKAYKLLSSDIRQGMDKIVNLSLDDVKIHIAPEAASIGAIDFEKGILVKGKMTAWGWHSSVSVKVDVDSGLEVMGAMDKLNFYEVFKVTGAQGNPSPMLNLKLSPTETPNLLISANVSLLGLSQDTQVKAGNSGFTFYFDKSLGGMLDTKLNCSIDEKGLKADGTIDFKLNLSIPTPFGDIPLNLTFNANVGIKTGRKDGFELKVQGSFNFMGKNVTMPTLTLTVSPNDFTALFNAVVRQITDKAGEMFLSVFKTLAEWANAFKDGVIKYAGEVASIAKNVYNASKEDVIAAYKTLGHTADNIADGLKNVYGLSADATATALKAANFTVNEVSNSLKNAYNLSTEATATALKAANYTVNEVGNSLKSVYNLSTEATATALKGAKFAVNEVGGFVQNSVGIIGGIFANYVTGIAVANALKLAGYGVDETGTFVKGQYNLAAKEFGMLMGCVGYAAGEVGNFMKGLGGTFSDVGNQIANGGAEAFNNFKNGASDTYNKTKDGIVNAAHTVRGWFSDGDFKTNIKENVPGLEFISNLRPVTYNLDTAGIEAHVEGNAEIPLHVRAAISTPSSVTITGFIAQEVEKTAKSIGYDFSGVSVPENNSSFYSLNYTQFVVPLVKAVQQLSNYDNKNEQIIKQQNAKIEEQEMRLAKLEALMK